MRCEESVFVPMTDMTVSFLFIVMILLAFFAVQFSDEDNVPRSVYEAVVAERNDLIEEVKLLNIEISKLKTLINELELENSKLVNQNDELTRENFRLDRDLNEALNRILELENIIASLELDLQRALKQNEIWTSDNKKFVARIQELYDEINVLIRTIDQKDELLRSKEDRIAFLKRIIEALYGQVSEKDIEISQLEEDLEELKAKLNDDPLEAYLIESAPWRTAILSEIERKLKIEFPDILVEVSPENDALRFKGDGLFKSGSSQLSASKRKIVEKVGSLIVDAIECYTINDKDPAYQICNPDGVLIEAVQIEGHTDNAKVYC